MLRGLNTPGTKSSEFLVTILTLVGAIVSAAQGYITSGEATKYGVAGAIFYIISRGLAKTEQRGSGGEPPQ